MLLIWPDSDKWPQDGESDYLENSSPGERCAEAFLHYPHDPGPTQQEFVKRCGVDMSQWHNIAFEWTPEGIKGFIDGVRWFFFRGGASSTRRCIQCMPSGHGTIQLDNFFGDNMQAGVLEVDWYREYAAPTDPPPLISITVSGRASD